jgi:hypothetical protein
MEEGKGRDAKTRNHHTGLGGGGGGELEEAGKTRLFPSHQISVVEPPGPDGYHLQKG